MSDECSEEKIPNQKSIGLKNDYFCSELGEQSRLGKEGIPESLLVKFAKIDTGDEDQCSLLFLLSYQ
jgi:hypothetical protein